MPEYLSCLLRSRVHTSLGDVSPAAVPSAASRAHSAIRFNEEAQASQTKASPLDTLVHRTGPVIDTSRLGNSVEARRGADAVRRATSVIALGIRATWCAAGHTETWTFRWQQLDAKRIIDGRNVTQRYSQPSALHHGGGTLSLWQYRVWVRSITSFEGFCERLIACACSSPCAS